MVVSERQHATLQEAEEKTALLVSRTRSVLLLLLVLVFLLMMLLNLNCSCYSHARRDSYTCVLSLRRKARERCSEGNLR